jgi:hypothetical protein
MAHLRSFGEEYNAILKGRGRAEDILCRQQIMNYNSRRASRNHLGTASAAAPKPSIVTPALVFLNALLRCGSSAERNGCMSDWYAACRATAYLGDDARRVGRLEGGCASRLRVHAIYIYCSEFLVAFFKTTTSLEPNGRERNVLRMAGMLNRQRHPSPLASAVSSARVPLLALSLSPQSLP